MRSAESINTKSAKSMSAKSAESTTMRSAGCTKSTESIKHAKSVKNTYTRLSHTYACGEFKLRTAVDFFCYQADKVETKYGAHFDISGWI